MSKFRIKATLEGVTKTLEVERGKELQLSSLKSSLEKLFGGNDLTLKYKSLDGRTEVMYQNFHLEAAVKDSEKSGAKYVFIQAQSTSGKGQASATIPVSNRPASTSFSKSNVTVPPPISSPPKSKFCEQCGTPLPPLAKFCSSCGAVTALPNSPRASNSSRSDPDNCFGCGNAVASSGLRALDHLWHKECFTCKKCRALLVERSFVTGDDGNPLCGDCYDEQFGKKCAKCSQAISGVFVNVDGKDYHKTCFVCSSCGSSFDGGYFMKEGKAHCKNCI